MNDNPFEIKEEACASSPDHRRYLLIQAVDTETGEIVWAVGDDQICAVTRADFIRTPEIRYNDVLIQEFPYKENTPESVGRWRPGRPCPCIPSVGPRGNGFAVPPAGS